jgi:hypothetical protein
MLWNWAKDVGLNIDELLLAQFVNGFTALPIAAYGKHVGMLEKLKVWAEEGQLNSNESKKHLLLAKDNQGVTA